MSFTDMIVPGLLFNKEGLGKVGKDEDYTLLAYGIVGLLAVIVPFYEYFTNQVPPASGYADSNVTGILLLIGLLLTSLMHDFLQIYFIALVARFLFKSELSYGVVLRVFAAVSIWNYISFILGLFMDLSFGIFLFFFLFNIALMIGLTTYDEGGFAMWKSFLSIVLGFVLYVAVNHVVGLIIKAIA